MTIRKGEKVSLIRKDRVSMLKVRNAIWSEKEKFLQKSRPAGNKIPAGSSNGKTTYFHSSQAEAERAGGKGTSFHNDWKKKDASAQGRRGELDVDLKKRDIIHHRLGKGSPFIGGVYPTKFHCEGGTNDEFGERERTDLKKGPILILVGKRGQMIDKEKEGNDTQVIREKGEEEENTESTKKRKSISQPTS